MSDIRERMGDDEILIRDYQGRWLRRLATRLDDVNSPLAGVVSAAAWGIATDDILKAAKAIKMESPPAGDPIGPVPCPSVDDRIAGWNEYVSTVDGALEYLKSVLRDRVRIDDDVLRLCLEKVWGVVGRVLPSDLTGCVVCERVLPDGTTKRLEFRPNQVVADEPSMVFQPFVVEIVETGADSYYYDINEALEKFNRIGGAL